MFNNDVRLRALKTLAEALAPIEQKKAILYFSAGMQRSGQDNQVELRAAINAAVRANVSIYPIDTRGLQAVVPGGDARQASGRGEALFSGRGVAQQFAQLVRLAGHADVARRGHRRARLHRHQRLRRRVRARAARHVGVLPARLQQHQSREGRPVPPHPGPREARAASASKRAPATTPIATSRTPAGTTARPSSRSSCSRRCRPPICRCWSPAAGSAWRPTATTCRSRGRPGSAVPVASGKRHGYARRARHGPRRTRQSGRPLPGDAGPAVGHRREARRQQVLYQSGVTLPPGRFSVKVVVRENTTGTMGSFEAPITVPELEAGRRSRSARSCSARSSRQPHRGDATIRWSATASSCCRT